METLEEIIYSLPLEVYREAEKLIVSNSYFFASLKAKIAGDKIELSPRNIKDLSKIVNQKVKSIKVQEDYTDIDTKKISELYTELMNFSHDKNTDDFFKETEKIKLGIQILKEQYLLERKIDLKRAAEPIIKNLERIKSKEEVAEISREINRLFNNKETKVSELERKLLEYNDLQKQEWIKKITNPEDFLSGEDFNWICHSVRGPGIVNGNYWNRYVSCSLITPKLNVTYNLPYGFILSPNDMVIAQDYDAYVINSARTEHKLQQFTTVNLIKNPEEVIEIISQIMEKNSKEKVLSEDLNFSEQKVYSEIVIDGFNAIGIFCLTNGSKELDKNYLGAKSLQKDNPSLKIYDVDLSLYEEKEIYTTALYESLAKENLRHYNKADNQFFEDIWQEFMLMKKEGRLSFSELKIMFNRRMDTLYKDDLSDMIAKKSDHKEIAIYFQKMLQLNNVINYLDLKHFLTNVYYNIVPYANDPLVWNTFDNIVIFIKMFNDEDDFQKMFNELSENEITWSSICNYYSKKELYSLDQREKLSFAEKDLAAINAELEKTLLFLDFNHQNIYIHYIIWIKAE